MTDQNSPVKTSRSIPASTRLFLYVQAGGRCEFDGCNEYLLEHYPTESIGNFAEQAHIFAFNEGGPRGKTSGRPKNINSLSNLMLLCAKCHHLVDAVKPSLYSIDTLKKFKREHEDRVFDLTNLSKDRDTIPLILKGLVNGRAMDISDEEMQSAVAPNYLKRRQKVEIDLTAVPDAPNKAFWETAVASIDQNIQYLYSRTPKSERTLRVSVFALAPIPLLVYLGSKLSDKMDVDLYQRHRDKETWTWKDGSRETAYIIRCLVQGDQDEPVSLFINLSGKNEPEDTLPAELRNKGSVYELTLEGQDPTPLFLNTRGDLERFTSEYHRALAMIRHAHPNLSVIHLFPAVPAPIAIILGRSRLPKVDPSIKVYDRDKRAGGFVSTLEIT
ncbi:MAG: SAVED domain-containing protein [Thermosynechococcaceae cyanobacterium]